MDACHSPTPSPEISTSQTFFSPDGEASVYSLRGRKVIAVKEKYSRRYRTENGELLQKLLRRSLLGTDDPTHRPL